MSSSYLYTDLSAYYDLMCADIDYHAQSYGALRLHQLFGNGGNSHLDLACGTGPHIRHLIDFGYQSSGLDINQPMLEQARTRCPEAHFFLGDMCNFQVDAPLDLITCFLYSIHYSASTDKLKQCIESAHRALKPGGVFCFNSVDKDKIDNTLFERHTVTRGDSLFTFSSAWYYRGDGEKQALKLSITKTTDGVTQSWDDEHPMVAMNFEELTSLLQPYFDVHILEHDYEKIVPWDKASGNALFVCVKT